ncbi:hypothetical protein PG997_008865 [Apiospora hydei]|uniref:Zn(2)-C6 fungal-type domain-containing protein n=1 Tax=Apiospora hydei TaxID=1337664 RepID=A0ABR1WC24_9PEZI
MKTLDNQPWGACDRCVQRKRPCWWTETETETLMAVDIWIVLLDRPKNSEPEPDHVGALYWNILKSAELQKDATEYIESAVAREYRDAYVTLGGHDPAVKAVTAGQGYYQPPMQDAPQSASNVPAGGELPTGAVNYSSGSTAAAPQAATGLWEPVADPWILDNKAVKKLLRGPVRIRWYLEYNLGKRRYNEIASDCDRCFLAQQDCGMRPKYGACAQCVEKAKNPKQACTYNAVKAARDMRENEPLVGELGNTRLQIERVGKKHREYSAQGNRVQFQTTKQQLEQLNAKLTELLSPRTREAPRTSESPQTSESPPPEAVTQEYAALSSNSGTFRTLVPRPEPDTTEQSQQGKRRRHKK